jgi:hypothetical protein
LPPILAISEDGTRVVSRIEYDHKTNQIVGFVSPIDRNGCPKLMVFPASCGSLILKYFAESPKATNAIVVMAQTVKEGDYNISHDSFLEVIQNLLKILDSPSFVLSVIPTANKFYSGDVMNRWTYTVGQY